MLARRRGVKVSSCHVRAGASRCAAPPDVTFVTHRRRIADLSLSARLPTIFFNRQPAEDGGLMSYGPHQLENYRRAAIYVDKIKGAKPQDLAIERPTKIELVINLKTAKELPLEVPPMLLARADEVIGPAMSVVDP
jgi:putative tryptophan/tyrosine transport system substrate-binding protein